MLLPFGRFCTDGSCAADLSRDHETWHVGTHEGSHGSTALQGLPPKSARTLGNFNVTCIDSSLRYLMPRAFRSSPGTARLATRRRPSRASTRFYTTFVLPRCLEIQLRWPGWGVNWLSVKGSGDLLERSINRMGQNRMPVKGTR